jgi:hypothetical protein
MAGPMAVAQTRNYGPRAQRAASIFEIVLKSLAFQTL